MKTRLSRILGAACMLAMVATPLANTPVLAADGSLDPTFGSGGIVTTDFATTAASKDYGRGVVIQSNGKIVVAGERIVYNNGIASFAFAVARYNPNGSLDTGFSGDGKVLETFGANASAHGLGLQADGKIVVVGGRWTGSANPASFAVARYNPDGTLDTTFGVGGKVTTAFFTNAIAYRVAIQQNGKIVVAGSPHFALARYNSNGSLDTTFGAGGKVVTTAAQAVSVEGLAIQTDGKIVIAGSSATPDFTLVRYNTNGSLDASFSSDGIVTTDIGGDDYATDVVVQADGKIVITGQTGYQAGTTQIEDFALVRYNAGGALDSAFGDHGVAKAHFNGYNSYPLAAVIRPDGDIIVAGSTQHLPPSVYTAFQIARFGPSGLLDQTFGTGGQAVIFGPDGPAGYGYATDLAIQQDGKIVVGGMFTNYYTTGTGLDFGLARLQQALPRAVDYSALMPPVGSQGEQGSCLAWALGYYYKSYQERIEHKWAYNYQHLFSPSYIYNQLATDNNGIPPARLQEAFDLVKQQGVPPLSEFPYNQNDWQTKPTTPVKHVAAAYKARNVALLYDATPLGTVSSLKRYLALTGPFVMLIPLYKGVQFNGWHTQIILDYPTVIDVPDPSFYPVTSYTHAVLVVGYDDRAQRFKFINSWGPTWGQNGFGYITYPFVQARYPVLAFGMADVLNDPVAPTTCSSLPPQPTIVAPTNGSASLQLRVFLDWFAQCATTFQVEVRADSSTGPIVQQNNGLRIPQFWTMPLVKGKTYFWRARACNGLGCSTWSGYKKFKVSILAN